MAIRSGTGNRPAPLKVIGGEDVSEDQYPAVRRLDVFKREDWGGFALQSRCTMTFVGREVALTAAHCVCHGDRYIYRDQARWEDFPTRRIERHPRYKCGDQGTASYDVALVWFDQDAVNMKHAAIAGSAESTPSGQLQLAGYGNNLLKITGSFWLGTRRVESFASKPERGVNPRQFNGKRSATIPWDGGPTSADGFIKVSAEFEVRGPGEVTPLSEFGGSGEGDSGGPAMVPETGHIIAVAALGAYSIEGIGSNRVKVSTHMVDLRRADIRQFLRNFEIIGSE